MKLNAVLGFLGSVVPVPFGSTQPKPPFRMSSTDSPVGRMSASTSGGANATDAARAGLNASTRDVGDLVANDSSSALTTKVTP
jgi:hypothetical protein